MQSKTDRGQPQSSPTSYTAPITRKRSNQLLNEPAPPTCHVAQSNPKQSSPSRTPRKPKKKARFSDPGPELHNSLDGDSTGLTPAMLRTSFEEPIPAYAERMARTPTRPSRRRSTPVLRPYQTFDSQYSFDDDSPQRVVQFTPLRQMLDARTRRRIKRTGLSEEMNHIQQEKRTNANYEKNMQALISERDALRSELESARNSRDNTEDGISTISNAEMSRRPKEGNDEEDTIMTNGIDIEGGTILVSESPDIRRINGLQSPVPDDLSLLENGHLGSDVFTNARLDEKTQRVENLALSADLEAARREKRDLFNACRDHISSLNQTALGRSLNCSSPPPDFLHQIVPTLTTALARASDATQALESVRQELSNLGFPGENAKEIVSELRDRFRSSRLELERLVPGETPASGLEDGNATLSALVRRVELLVKNLDDERRRHNGSLGRETALRGQFNTLLVRHETASRKIRNLEDTISSSAGELYHARKQVQGLEQGRRNQAIVIDRLNTALQKYHKEVESLGAVVKRLEGEKADIEKARQEAESAALAHETHIHKLEETIEQNRIRACDLTAQVESLEKERQKAIESVEQRTSEQIQRKEYEIGSMNVQISELSTALEAARSEAGKLRQINVGLEEQLQLEVDARNDLLDRWAADQARSFAYMKETVQKDRRRAKARAANWEMRSDDIQSDSINIGSEPTTPVSMTRFVDVEVGRGKHRRRVDSGIGFLSEDMLDDEAAVDLPSDPANL